VNQNYDKDLTMPAARLALAAPREWKEFVDAMKAYTDTRRDLLVQAPQDTVLKAQGQALQCGQLHTLLNDAVNAANRATAPGGKPKT